MSGLVVWKQIQALEEVVMKLNVKAVVIAEAIVGAASFHSVPTRLRRGS